MLFDDRYPSIRKAAKILGLDHVAGGLGIMIPPSTSFIVYGLLTEQSIGKLFIAGIIPGIILSVLFMGTAYYLCRRDPSNGSVGRPATFKEKLISLKGLTDTIILFFITIGGTLLPVRGCL